jgi:hypothetical protein
MAQQETLKRATATAKTVNKGGRPAGSRNAPKVKTFDYERYKLSFQKSADFYAYIEGYPDKSGLLISVYRLRPRIDHSLIGNNQSAILQTSNVGEVTEEAIGENFGRGHYMLKLNDANRVRGQQECCRTWLELMDVEKPPQYDPRTLCLGEAKNQDEITRLLNAGVLVRDTHGAPHLRGEGDPLPVASAAASNGNGHAGGDLFGRDVVGQIVLAALNRGTQSPHDSVRDTIEVAKLLVTPAAPVPTLDQIADAVALRMNGGIKRVGVDPFDAWERVQGFVDKVRGPAAGAIVGAVAGESAGIIAGSWAPHLGGILAQARSLIPEIVGAIRELRMGNGANGQTGAPRNGGGQMPPLEVRIEQVFQTGFQKMQEGVTGFDFASWVCFHMPGGLEVYKVLEPSGAQGLIALAAMNARARPIVNDPKIRPQLEAFLADFFTFDTGSAPPDELAPGSAASV